MLTVHHLEHSRSFRILWAMEELGLEYTIKLYKRLASQAAPPELKKIHALGKAPILTTDEETIAESAVILEFLQDEFDSEHKFKPQDKKALRQYQYWMHYAEGSLMPYLVMTLVVNSVPNRAPFLIRPVAKKIVGGIKAGFLKPRIKEHIQYLESYLSQHEYFAGDAFSFADVQMGFPLIAMQERVGGDHPNIDAFIERMKVRPAYLRAMIREQNLEK
jgi:glutathione S-transferase